MVSPVADTYFAASNEEVRAGSFTVTAIDVGFTDGVASTGDLSTDIPEGVAISQSGTWPAAFTVKPLTRAIVYDGTPGATSDTLNLSINPATPVWEIQNANAASLPFVQAGGFPKGALFADALGSVAGGVTGSAVIKRRWNDGSVKHAVAMGVFPADTPIRFTDVPASGANLTEADIIAATPESVVTMGAYSSALSARLGDPLKTPYSTPDMVECWYTGQLGGTLMWARWQVTLFKNGDMRVRAMPESGDLDRNGTESFFADNDFTVTIFGQTVWDVTAESNYRNWRVILERWNTTQYDFTVSHDTQQWQKTELVPSYATVPAISEANLNGIAQTYTIGSLGDHRNNMAGTGFDPGHGILPGWEVSWLVSNDSRAYKGVLVNSMSAFQMPLLWLAPDRDIATPLDNSDASYKTNGDGATLLENGVFEWDDAHNPGFYLAYLITGDELFLELMKSNAMGFFQICNKNEGLGLSRVPKTRQVRGIGWMYKQLGFLAGICPDGDPDLASYQTWLLNNVNYGMSVTVDDPAVGADGKLGIPWFKGNHDIGIGFAFATPPWMHNYWNQSIGATSDTDPLPAADMPRLTAFRDWLYRLPVLMCGDDTGYCFTEAYQYDVSPRVGDLAWNDQPTAASEMYDDPNDMFENTRLRLTGISDSLCNTNTLQDSPENAATSYWGVHWASMQLARKHVPSFAAAGWARVRGASNYSALEGAGWNDATGHASPYGLSLFVPPATSSRTVAVTVSSGGGVDPIPGDVVNNVWTPSKNGNGKILPGSVAAVPLSDENNHYWVRIADTAKRHLQDKIEAAMGKTLAQIDRGHNSITNVFDDWVGGCLAVDKFFVGRGGGHDQCSLNLWAALNIEYMGGPDTWDCPKLPSDPNEPGYEWRVDYDRNFSVYKEALDGVQQDTVPDPTPVTGNTLLTTGAPTSAHTYAGIAYDSSRNEVSTFRYALWSLDLDTLAYRKNLYNGPDVDGAANYSNTGAIMFYDEVHDYYIGFHRTVDTDKDQNMRKIDPLTGLVTKMSFISGGTKFTNAADRMPGTRHLWFSGYNDSVGVEGAYCGRWDMDAEAWDYNGDIVGDIPQSQSAYSDADSFVCIPEWNKHLRLLQGVNRWFVQDTLRVTGVGFNTTEVMPQGHVLPVPDKPGNKIFRYEPWKGVIYIAGVATDMDSIMFMRTG